MSVSVADKMPLVPVLFFGKNLKIMFYNFYYNEMGITWRRMYRRSILETLGYCRN
jgi:hypothetical protein